GQWWEWNGSAWPASAPPPSGGGRILTVGPGQIGRASRREREGSTVMAGASGTLVTSAGTWSFSPNTGVGGDLILLNGQSAGNGSATELEVANGGEMYAYALGQWWEWNGSAWPASAPPPSGGGRILTVGPG